MSYSDFLDTLISPIRLFVSALSQVADSLIHNYIIITLLGLTLFISLVWLIYYTFHNFINSKIDKIEDKIDRYNSYELYKETQREYLDKHRVDEFMYLYDLTILKQQVLNGIYRNNPDVLLDNITQFNKLRAKALKSIKKEYENDNDSSNDDDIDYIIPTPPIQKASIGELKQTQQNAWLKEYSQDLEEQIVNNVDRIMHENHDLLSKFGLSYDKKNNTFFDIKTGDVVNLDNFNSNFYDENLLKYYKNDSRMISDSQYVRDYLTSDLDYKLNPSNLEKFKKSYSYINYRDDDFDKHFSIQNNGWILDKLTNDEYYFDNNFTGFKSSDKQNVIKLGRFAYYDKKDKIMKTIMLPVDSDDLKKFQFDNKNLSDVDRDFVSNHTLIRIG